MGGGIIIVVFGRDAWGGGEGWRVVRGADARSHRSPLWSEHSVEDVVDLKKE